MRLQLASLVATAVIARSGVKAAVALLADVDPMVAAERHALLHEAIFCLSAQHLAHRRGTARREAYIVGMVALVGVRVHDVVAAVVRGGRAARVRRIVLAAPVVAELVARYQLGLALQKTRLPLRCTSE